MQGDIPLAGAHIDSGIGADVSLHRDFSLLCLQIHQFGCHLSLKGDGPCLCVCHYLSCHIHCIIKGYTASLQNQGIQVPLGADGICHMQISVAPRQVDVPPGLQQTILVNDDVLCARSIPALCGGHGNVSIFRRGLAIDFYLAQCHINIDVILGRDRLHIRPVVADGDAAGSHLDADAAS